MSNCENIPLIILAAGNSSRMGTPKGLLEYQDQPWIQRQWRAYYNSGGKRVIVILGHHHNQYLLRLHLDLNSLGAWLPLDGLEIVCTVNPSPGDGPFSSILCALPFLEQSKASFILPVDVPLADSLVLKQMADVMSSPVRAVVPRYKERGGHPVLLSQKYLNDLSKLPSREELRLDRLLRKLPKEHIIFIPVKDKRVILNLNYPSDWHDFVN